MPSRMFLVLALPSAKAGAEGTSSASIAASVVPASARLMNMKAWSLLVEYNEPSRAVVPAPLRTLASCRKANSAKGACGCRVEDAAEETTHEQNRSHRHSRHGTHGRKHRTPSKGLRISGVGALRRSAASRARTRKRTAFARMRGARRGYRALRRDRHGGFRRCRNVCDLR